MRTELPPLAQLRKAVFGGAAKKAELLLFSVAVLLAGGAAAVRGQSALDGFDPNVNGSILVTVVQPDGKILLCGGFTTLSPNGGPTLTRTNLARLNPDGTLDTVFNPNPNSFVRSIKVQADGKILAVGDFTNIGGQPRNFIARLDASTGSADSFNPNASNSVYSIAVQADGKILACGAFTGIGGQTRHSIARLDATTGLADTFDPNANSAVLAIAVQADGKVLAGGAFSGTNSIGGQTRNYIARLDASTGVADSWDPNSNGDINTIAVQADGKILAGGFFTAIGGQPRNRIARVDAATGMADSFNPSANSTVNTIAVQADGKILAGGAFVGANSIGGQARNRIARLDPATSLADTFDPNANSTVTSIAVQADGKILAAGNFITLTPNGGAAVTRNRIARLETDGRLDQTLDLSIVGAYVLATAVQPDGKLLIGGHFTTVLGAARANIARLNPDGTVDPAFNPGANGDVLSIALQADGKILVGGSFNGTGSFGGQTRNYIARLTTTGSVDSFNPNANSTVYSIALQADGKILVGGGFNGANSIGGQNRNRIARLDATTGLADSFNPNANFDVNTIALQADGKILVGGFFFGSTGIGGQNRNRIARLDATTGLADSFNPNANDVVRCIAVQADGKILAGGEFKSANSIGGATRNYIARLDPTTGAADSFDPNANGFVLSIALQADGKILAGGSFNGSFTSIGGQPRNNIARLDPTTGFADSFDPNASRSVESIAVQADGKILAGGTVTNIGGQPRNFFARLSNDTGARQNLAVTQTTITWTLSGSSPQSARVTFDFLTNNVNYTPLGNGIPQSGSSNWTLTGLSLPTGQNLYIRARGFYRGGLYNSSESIMESVWDAFLAPPPPLLNIQLTANANAVLSWATNFTSFTLEANTNINTNLWSAVSPAPAVSGTNNVVTNAITETQKFYRLVKP